MNFALLGMQNKKYVIQHIYTLTNINNSQFAIKHCQCLKLNSKEKLLEKQI